jgi:hypothetical protein
MKRFHGVLAAAAALVLATGMASACDGEKTAQKVSTDAKVCSSAKTVSTDAKSCGSAKTVSTAAKSCGSAAKTVSASAGSCGSAAKTVGMTASSCAAKCASKTAALTAKACATTHVVYRVGEMETFDRSEALQAAETNGASVQYVAAGTAYDDEGAAKAAMTQAIYARLNEMLTVSTTLGGEAKKSCGASAVKVAETSAEPTRYTVAGHDFDSKEAAEAFLAKAKAAVEAIQLMDTEGHAVEGCAVGYSKSHPKTAFKLGEQTIECPVTANYTAAQAKMSAILSMDA